MLKGWWAAMPAAVLTAMAALQFYGLHQLHASQKRERASLLQRATYLFATEANDQVSVCQNQLTTAGTDTESLRAAWQALPQPDLVHAIWVIEAADDHAAVKITRDEQTRTTLTPHLQAWRFGTTPPRGVPPLLLDDGATGEPVVAVVWDERVFRESFLPWCFARALQNADSITYRVVNAATGETLTGHDDWVADGSSHFYPTDHINSAGREDPATRWHNPLFTPASAGLHFESSGVLRLETRLAGGNLAALARRQLMRDGLPALLSLLLLAFTFAALITYLRRARALSQQQAAMMAAFSHELRTPLATIGMAGENLADATVYDPDKVRAYGRLITGESNRLNTMVLQVLQYSRLFSAGRQNDDSQADVTAGLAQVERELALLLEGKRCKLRIDCPTAPPVAVEPEALLTILRNLISNAIKFGPEQRTVDIAVTPKRQQRRAGLAIQVTDHGYGIPKGERRRVYQQFYRGVRARADQIQGTGLGLSLVAKLVHNAQGRIDHHSQEGHGTTFTVWLPQATESQP